MKIAKQHHLFFWYLGFGHFDQTCSKIQTCCIDGCKEMHKSMLHGKHISGKKSADEKKKSTDTAESETNNPIKTAVSYQRTLKRSNQEIEKSNRNQESARRRSTEKRYPTLLLQIKTWV